MKRHALALAPVAAYGATLLIAAACTEPGASHCVDGAGVRYDDSIIDGLPPAYSFAWPRTFQPIRVWTEANPALEANVDTAIALWTSAMHCHELALVRVANSDSADILFFNPDAFPATTVRTYPLAADSVGACNGRTDVTMNIFYRLQRPIRSYVIPLVSDSAALRSCYHFVTAHELGHALGILGHSKDPDDLMYAVPRRRVLTDSDIFTIQHRYNNPVTVTPTDRSLGPVSQPPHATRDN